MADPIGDETDGEAKAAVEPDSGPETLPEIEAAEVEALAEAEIEDGPYAGSDPATIPQPELPQTELEGESEGELESEDEFEDELESEGQFEGESPSGSELESEDEFENESPSEGELELEDEAEPEAAPTPRPPAKLERLQKILAQAGIASRRRAEDLITEGRVQVNGKVVTELGSKADAGRDHIRVDGKLLHGAERLRYFVLNKPRGFVTTVKDPEGRPTVMQFFEKMPERLYPVGRLDYMSEGLLLVTNDGELANRLTRAAAGVEKTYLVKVAGQPSEAELDILRAGVAIEKGKPGSPKVRTSPARIRQVRQGDNPWYEVVLIEGRNRELRKMFEEVGHFVEKIRRVGYGPLVLDQEPGKLRELDPQELALLRKAADGTLRTPKAKEVRRRNLIDAELPTVAPRPTTHPRPAKPFAAKSFEERPAPGPKDYLPRKPFDRDSGGGGASRLNRPDRPARPTGKNFGPARPAWKKDDRADRTDRPPFKRSGPPSESRPPAARPFGERPSTRPAFGAKPPADRTYGAKPASPRPFAGKPSENKSFRPKPAFNKPAPGRSDRPKPDWSKPSGGARPPFNRPAPPRRETPRDDDFGPVRPPNLRIEEIHGPDRSGSARSSSDRPSPARPSSGRPAPNRSSAPRPSAQGPGSPRPDSFRPSSDRSGGGRPGARPSGPGRSSPPRPFRSEGGLARPFSTSSGKPRAGGARPSSKPSGPSRGSSRPGSSGSSGPRSTGPRPGGGAGWKPKPSFGGASKSGYKGKPSGPKRSGKPGGKKRG